MSRSVTGASLRTSLGPAPDGPARRILDAVGECVARWGWAKTTVDDVARAAGVGRATVYREFPGGRESLLEAHRRKAVAGFFAALDAEVGDVAALEDLLVAMVTASARMLADDEPLQRALVEEPGSVLPMFDLDGLDRIFAAARIALVPHLARHLDRRRAVRTAELLTRTVLTYWLCPTDAVVLTDEASVRSLVRTRILPGLRPAAGPRPPEATP